jgi:osmotically-inducible protein OsmY
MFTNTQQTHASSRLALAAESSSPSRTSGRPDADIQIDVERVLRHDAVLRGTGDHVDVLVKEGVAYLSGYVPTYSHTSHVEDDVREVPGVWYVENHLVADSNLEIMVADRLAQDPQLGHQSILVRSTHGVLRLDGEVDSPELVRAAVCLAASVASVRGVLNMLHVPGTAANGSGERVFWPSVGQEVFAADGLLGRVERVILDPDSRLVTAIVVKARFYDPPDASYRMILIPSFAMKLVDPSGVELRIASDEVARRPDFDATQFATPNPDWPAPYGYVPTDLLLDPHARFIQPSL